VIDELRHGGIKTTMLTGDAIDAALAVAWTVGFMNETEVAVLETEGAADGTEDLRWRIVKRKPGKKASFKTATTIIKPGEASLVAAFSCLHPSIDGVDSILRTGIATAACALATHDMIALHSLMSCYYLVSLYRDGFRYGKNM
jgi:hypothetical protein